MGSESSQMLEGDETRDETSDELAGERGKTRDVFLPLKPERLGLPPP